MNNIVCVVSEKMPACLSYAKLYTTWKPSMTHERNQAQITRHTTQPAMPEIVCLVFVGLVGLFFYGVEKNNNTPP